VADVAILAALMAADAATLDALDVLLARPAWHRDAACRGHGPADFYVDRGGGYDDARRLCAGCPVAAQCAEAGLSERWGLWGGATPSERRSGRSRAA